MNEPPKYPPVETPANPTVERSISRPDAFSKPGSVGKPAAAKQGTRFRPLAAKRTPGRPRKHRKDPRSVTFY